MFTVVLTVLPSRRAPRAGCQFAGTFQAAYLVVTAADHPRNHLGRAQRQRWTASIRELTLDIGCAHLALRKAPAQVA